MQIPLPVRQRGNCCEITLDLAPSAVAGTVSVLKALADPTRLQIMAALMKSADPVCVCDFTEATGLSQPTVSHHIGKLRQAGLIRVTRSTLWSFYEVAPDLPAPARALLQSAVAMGAAPVTSPA